MRVDGAWTRPAGVKVHRIQKVQKVQRVVVAAVPQFLKSALRDWLYESYSLIRITMMSHLRWLPPLWCLTAPPFPRGIGRATKGKRLYGQARRLTSPDLHILCRMCTVDNKTLKSGPRIKFPCHRTQGHYGIYLPVSSGKWRSAKVSFLGAASFTWAAYVRVFVLSFL